MIHLQALKDQHWIISLLRQARLMAQQQRLQKRLKFALRHHLRPKTTVDTMTIADKIVSALDRIAEVGTTPSKKALPAGQLCLPDYRIEHSVHLHLLATYRFFSKLQCYLN